MIKELEKARKSKKFKIFKYKVFKDKISIHNLNNKKLGDVPIKCETRVPSLSDKPWIEQLLKDEQNSYKQGKRPSTKNKFMLIIEIITRIFGG